MKKASGGIGEELIVGECPCGCHQTLRLTAVELRHQLVNR